MQSVLDYVRLGVGGLLLDQSVYQQQREASDRLQRGFILVAAIALVVGFATLVGQVFEALTSPSDEAVVEAVYDGIVVMPWYQNITALDPGFAAQFEQQFDQISGIIQLMDGGGILGGVVGFVLAPFSALLGWLIFSLFAHVIARMLGGEGTLSQTLGCTALASGVSLLGVVQIVPYAQVAGLAALGLIANYVAIREAHTLSPGRAFWATVAGPLVLSIILVGIFCLFFSAIANFLSGQGGGF